MQFISRYTSHKPDEQGLVTYSSDENKVWQTLYQRQMPLLKGRACDEFIQGVSLLRLSQEKIPQLPEVSQHLFACTGWQVVAVEALISPRAFFTLLANKQFPAATFIRTMVELDYVTEPDIFHELYGHCPMLTNAVYADFMHRYAQLVLTFPEKDWPLLQRLFWFTVEFGLIKTQHGLRGYGGGILSSISETVYCIESQQALRVLFDPVAVFRTPYRIDCLQAIYFVIDNYQQLYAVVSDQMASWISQARALGEYPPFFSAENNNPNIHIHAC
jgi:phenylalanine-4-hydroxylase